MKLQELKEKGLAPEFLTEEGYSTLINGYLLENETPIGMYKRVAKAAAKQYNDVNIENKFFNYMWKGWLCPSTPVAANMGTNRALPISCFSSYVPDNLYDIFSTVQEAAMMSKYGGGTSIHLKDLRPAKSAISKGGTSSGVISWLKVFDSMIASTSQGATRRGALASYLPVEHPDIHDFLRVRRPEGDHNRWCPNIHHGVNITDNWMQDMLSGDIKKREAWAEILKTRFETGEPYLFFIDHAQKGNPKHLNWYEVKGSNLCSEIFLHTDKDNSLVCCLSSLNLTKYDEWKNTDLVKTSIYFLDGVMQEFIDKAKNIQGLERAVNFATKSRALGLGVLGWHSLLQLKNLPFDSFETMMLNAEIFSNMNKQSLEGSKELAKLLGEPAWMEGTGLRNTHRLAIAPTVSNSTISGNVSAGIEPLAANVYVKKSAKGTFIQYNPILKAVLQKLSIDNDLIWTKIIKQEGSVFGIKEIPEDVQQTFLTAREINQFAIIKQAGQRQKFIDQGQSVNLFFASNSDPSYINKVHLMAWEEGLKSLYYLRSSSSIRADLASRGAEECAACEG